jgi:hypothetical protein
MKTIRKRYTWHLRPAFRDHFDCSHWWDGNSVIEPGAALYELARRHPFVREHWLKAISGLKGRHRKLGVGPRHPFFGQGKFSEAILDPHWFSNYTRFNADAPVPPSLYWTCTFGLKSWAQLDYTDRNNWLFSAGHMKGLDFRQQELQCRSITQLADWKIRDKREIALGDKVKGLKRGLEIGRVINADLAAHPRTAEEWQAAISETAVELQRQGYLLLAFAPDLTVDKTTSLAAKAYREDRRMYSKKAQPRARVENWLPLISAFEDAESRTGGAKSQVFTRYRRAVDGLRFT